AAGSNQLLGAGGGDVEWLFHQDMLARSRTPDGDVGMGIGRREDGNGFDAPVIENGVKAVAKQEWEFFGKGGASLGARRISMNHLHLIGEVNEALGVGCHGHAETDYGYAGLAHGIVLVSLKKMAPGIAGEPCLGFLLPQGPNHCTGTKVKAGTNVTSSNTSIMANAKGITAR